MGLFSSPSVLESCGRSDEIDCRLRWADQLGAGHKDLAAFVRVQCELHRLGEVVDEIVEAGGGVPVARSAEYARLKREERRLLSAFGDVWAAEVKLPPVDTVRFAKGCPDRLTVNAAHPDLPDCLDRLPGLAPTVRAITFMLPPGRRAPSALVDQILRFEAATRVDRLALVGGGWGDAAARAIAGSVHARRLKSLTLSDCRLGPAAVKAIVSSPYLGDLEYLNLGGNGLLEDGFAALALLPAALPALRQLDLGGTGMTDAAAEHLAGGPALTGPGLTELTIAGNPLTAAGVRHFLNAEHLADTWITFDARSLPAHSRGETKRRLDRHNGIRTGHGRAP
ncbi:MAG TPA: hypothetical protein VD866_22325 [Urbifossiella sp.]|nr:hypothetical protein [Urbifossiella sp.]